MTMSLPAACDAPAIRISKGTALAHEANDRSARILPGLITLLGLALCCLAPRPGAAAPPRLADFGFDMDNTSPAPTTAEEKARIARLDMQLAELLTKSGLYQVVDLAGPAAGMRATTVNIRDCNGCERPVALQNKAELAAYGWVQKVSDLILNINLVIEDAKTGKQVAGGSVDIRGNTDESWSRGLRFLFEEHVLPQTP
jgi:hypothetical protein